MSDETGGIIVHLFGPPPAVDGAPDVQRDFTCYPHSPVIDKTSRTVTCRRCKALLDPIDVLIGVARDHDRWVALNKETRQMRQEVESLKAEEKRVKARTRSASRKEATAAVDAERMKHYRQHLEVLQRTAEIRQTLKRIDQLVGMKGTVDG